MWCIPTSGPGTPGQRLSPCCESPHLAALSQPPASPRAQSSRRGRYLAVRPSVRASTAATQNRRRRPLVLRRGLVRPRTIGATPKTIRPWYAPAGRRACRLPRRRFRATPSHRESASAWAPPAPCPPHAVAVPRDRRWSSDLRSGPGQDAVDPGPSPGRAVVAGCHAVSYPRADRQPARENVWATRSSLLATWR